MAQLAQKCELFLFYLSSVYIYHTNIIAYSYKCIQIYIYRYMYLYLCVYLCMSLHICGETITNWSLPKIHKTATKISRSLKSPWTQGFWSISVLFVDPFLELFSTWHAGLKFWETDALLPDLPVFHIFHDLGTGHGDHGGIGGIRTFWGSLEIAASEHRSYAMIDSLHHPHKLPLVEETVVVSIKNAQQEADLLFLGNDLCWVREGQGSHQIGET